MKTFFTISTEIVDKLKRLKIEIHSTIKQLLFPTIGKSNYCYLIDKSTRWRLVILDITALFAHQKIGFW